MSDEQTLSGIVKGQDPNFTAKDFLNSVAQGNTVDLNKEKLVDPPKEPDVEPPTEPPVNPPGDVDNWGGYGTREKFEESHNFQKTHINTLEDETKALRAKVELLSKPQIQTDNKIVDKKTEPPEIVLPEFKKIDPELLDDDMKKFYDEQTDNNNKLRDVVQSLVKQNKEQGDIIEKQKQLGIDEQNKNNQNDYWKGIEAFRKNSSEFASDKDVKMKDVDTECIAWENRLAVANGVILPQNATYEDNSIYNQKVDLLVEKVLSGSPDVVANDPPKGANDYYKLGKVESYRKSMIANKTFGEDISLEQAYKFYAMDNGIVQENVKKEVEKQVENVHNAKIKALAQGEEYAKDIKGVPPTTTESQGEKLNAVEFLETWKPRYASDPEKLKQRDLCLEALGSYVQK